jgi:hypothetical protein
VKLPKPAHPVRQAHDRLRQTQGERAWEVSTAVFRFKYPVFND